MRNGIIIGYVPTVKIEKQISMWQQRERRILVEREQKEWKRNRLN
jgi:hypothetical protein